ncbi:hypothetical protein D2E33_05980 [Mycobacteroides abscessus]|nr:hypothetical protein D2E33_05980 [Mycobacteroides abscessus]RIT70848.1 hypothetical protein D2E87_10750 [Mycobacteroides abscessus]
MCFTCTALCVGESGVESLMDLSGEIFSELERGVVIDDRLLDSRYSDVWQVAEAVLSCAAQEIAISPTASSCFCVG